MDFKARLTIQDFKLALSQHPDLEPPFPTQRQVHTSFKKLTFSLPNHRQPQSKLQIKDELKAEKDYNKNMEVNMREASRLLKRKLIMLPQNMLESIQSRQIQTNPEEHLPTYSSLKLGKPSVFRISKNSSERYKKKIEALRQFKIPIFSQPRFTFSEFTNEALNSIPKHVEILNQKLKMIKRTHPESDRYHHRDQSASPVPSQLRTLRVIRKTSEQRMAQRQQKHKINFRSTVLKQRSQKKEDGYKIEGWQSQNNDR